MAGLLVVGVLGWGATSYAGPSRAADGCGQDCVDVQVMSGGKVVDTQTYSASDVVGLSDVPNGTTYPTDTKGKADSSSDAFANITSIRALVDPVTPADDVAYTEIYTDGSATPYDLNSGELRQGATAGFDDALMPMVYSPDYNTQRADGTFGYLRPKRSPTDANAGFPPGGSSLQPDGRPIRIVAHLTGRPLSPTVTVAAAECTACSFTVGYSSPSASPAAGTTLVYDWDFGDGSTDQTSTPDDTHTYDGTADHTVRVEVTASDGSHGFGYGSQMPSPTPHPDPTATNTTSAPGGPPSSPAAPGPVHTGTPRPGSSPSSTSDPTQTSDPGGPTSGSTDGATDGATDGPTAGASQRPAPGPTTTTSSPAPSPSTAADGDIRGILLTGAETPVSSRSSPEVGAAVPGASAVTTHPFGVPGWVWGIGALLIALAAGVAAESGWRPRPGMMRR